MFKPERIRDYRDLTCEPVLPRIDVPAFEPPSVVFEPPVFTPQKPRTEWVKVWRPDWKNWELQEVRKW